MMFNPFDQRSDAKKTRQSLTPAMAKKLKEATGDKCEICKKKYPKRNLKIHHITEVHKASGSRDLNTPSNVLVLCSICHDNAHHKPIQKNKQKEYARKRSDKVKTSFKGILRNRTKVNDSNYKLF